MSLIKDTIDAGTCSVLSVVSGIFAFISAHNAISVLSVIGSLVAVISGVLAGRYYWYAAEEKKKILKAKDDERV